MSAIVITSTAAHADCTMPTALLPLCLDGTTVAGSYKSAIVEESGAPGQINLRPNDTIMNWRVIDIGEKYIKLQKNENVVEIGLQADLAMVGNIKKGPMQRMHAWEQRGEREPPQ